MQDVLSNPDDNEHRRNAMVDLGKGKSNSEFEGRESPILTFSDTPIIMNNAVVGGPRGMEHQILL